MKFKKCFSQIMHVFLGAMLTVSANAQSASSQKYDFNYRVSDERISIFDDGKVTRIQLPEGMTIPIVMSQEPAGDVLLDLKKDSPYLSIQGTYSKLVMRWSGKREVVASYNGHIEIERQGRPAAFGMIAPTHSFGSVAEPVLFEKNKVVVKTDESAPTLVTLEKQINVEPIRNSTQPAAAISAVSVIPPVTHIESSRTAATTPEVAPKPIQFPGLSVRSGERLMPMLKKWLADQNVELVWAANAQTAGRVRDVVFEDDFESSSADISVALTEVLSPFGFEAEISTNASMRRVTVRNLRGNL
jgi:hypothetical protein